MWYVYILECSDKALYVGMTDDVERRFKEHLLGIGGHYTAYNKPTKILYTEKLDLRSQAEAREKQIKRWTQKKKMALVLGDFEHLRSLSISRD
jgi:putative endonuclease